MSREKILERITGRDEWLRVPSVFKNDSGQPEFEMLLAKRQMRDPGTASLYSRETRTGGFEYASRAFIHAHIRPGDLFIDVGAHFGLYTLTAAMKFPGKVNVLAVEPHPDNVGRLKLWTEFNECRKQVIIAECAASDRSGRSILNLNSSMGHSLLPYPQNNTARKLEVRLETLDRLVSLTEFAESDCRIFIKIDTEGHEYQVLTGALGLLKSGRVAAVIWEKGHFQGTEAGLKEFALSLALLRDLGFESYRFPHEDMGGPLVPYGPSHEQCNIISIDKSLERLPVYHKQWTPHTILPPSMRPPVSDSFMAGYTRMLMEHKTTDCGRWSRWNYLSTDADLRAGMAGRLVPEGSNVLDAGAGLLLLRDYIPEDCSYTPLDIVARSRNCIVADLNQQQYPKTGYDVICALGLFEFLHDPESFMKWARKHSGRLIFTYHIMLPGKDLEQRRAAGFFNDYKQNELETIIRSSGWKIRSFMDIGRGQACLECI
ncbi:FkbM family methyltransferase [Maridesulfovibrio sp.]|uniref:FkbM family methyltransferase n=1 Tax=Maridesulfovibrio sp. TaxID=2795000 RepID=UPI002A18C126|nr:FkbM family methyltransferase [Maridesulfovibrio sp.]